MKQLTERDKKINTLISNVESLLIFIAHNQEEDFLSEFSYTIISAGIDSEVVVDMLADERFDAYDTESIILGIKINEGW